ncbi:unnamed protein product [Rodentolepis nana]|uniref:Annexin n=1 Tax=Rodentolepis nana TaxID=102285 RepID=A0A0R3T0F5_RODNA|nr:unnamed protein product [Rodentolepis nana]
MDPGVESRFDANQDAQAIHEAMGQLSLSKDRIIEMIAHIPLETRVKLPKYFERMGEDIIQKLKSVFREDLELAILWSFYDRAHLNAAALQKAMNATETDNDLLIHVICTADEYEIRPMKGAFQEITGKCLLKAIDKECRGDFKRVLVAIIEGYRVKEYDEVQARIDAKELFAASGDKLETTFIRILCGSSMKQTRLIDKYYQVLSGHDLITVIEKALSGDVGKSLKLIVNFAKNRIATLSEMLYESLQGGVTRSASVIRIVLALAEGELGLIKVYFDLNFEQSLAETIGAQTSGDYKKFLLALFP